MIRLGDVADEAETRAWRSPPSPPLGMRSVHVWRIRLGSACTAAHWLLLSEAERTRANRFHQVAHQEKFVIAHGMLRRIVSQYLDQAPTSLEFALGPHGKPYVVCPPGPCTDRLEFNLSHSGDFALVAVSRGSNVGVDVEQWRRDIEHLDLAEHFFSAMEVHALEQLAGVHDHVVAGFFSAWSRKEAYLKATGVGIARGLDHFDVELVPDQPARLLADARDPSAPERWTMTALPVASGYSAALVAEAPIDQILLFDAT